MKWFKHQSSARNDERIASLEDKAGLEGYGFYFKMLEIVAEIIDGTDKCEVTYSLSRWGRQANIASKKWIYLAQCCADVGLMIVCRLPDDGVTKDYRIAVKIPNLLKYRDNHTKNLQATVKQEVERDTEKEEKKIETKTEQKPKASASRSPSIIFPAEISDQLQNDFIALRKAKKSPVTQTAIDGIEREAEKAGLSLQAALEMCCQRGWAGFKADWVKDGNQAQGVSTGGLSKAGQATADAAQSWLRKQGATA